MTRMLWCSCWIDEVGVFRRHTVSRGSAGLGGLCASGALAHACPAPRRLCSTGLALGPPGPPCSVHTPAPTQLTTPSPAPTGGKPDRRPERMQGRHRAPRTPSVPSRRLGLKSIRLKGTLHTHTPSLTLSFSSSECLALGVDSVFSMFEAVCAT